MKTLIVYAILVWTISSLPAVAQQPTTPPPATPPPPPTQAQPTPPSTQAVPTPPSNQAIPNPAQQLEPRDLRTGYRKETTTLPGGSPWAFPTYVDPSAPAANANGTQIVTLPMPSALYPLPELRNTPAKPPQPVTHEYNWHGTESASDSFSIALKDGTVRFVRLVWMQEGALHYTSKDGAEGSIVIESIDKDTTRRLNAEKGINLALPPV